MNYIPIIQELGIKYDSKKVNNNWLQCHCISGIHKDENPSMGIHLQTGIINCFACGLNTNIYKLIQQKLNISYKQAIEYILGENYNEHISKDAIQNLKIEESIKNKIYEKPKQNYPFISIPLKEPEKYLYTKMRGYTKEYCEQFNIQICLSGLYTDYFITPIIDTEQQFISYEARKLKQFEKMRLYFLGWIDAEMELPYEYMQIEFKNMNKQKKEKGIELTQEEKWLKLNKVLYPSGHRVNTTIFNIDNLNFNEDLILFEGLATHVKVYQYISKNCTSIFGANISNEQISILKQFKKDIYIISDNDPASYALINRMNKYFTNIKVFNCVTDDIQDSFVEDIKNSKIISAAEFLVKREYL